MPSSSKKGSEAESSKKPEALPFEPRQTRKQLSKKTPTASVEAKKVTASPSTKQGHSVGTSPQGTAIPEVVSRRMAKRMALFSGIPTVLGVLTFIVSYVIVSQHWFKLPNIAVVLVSMGLFGLGVLGLSYGVISASWDEDRLGSWHGWGEFVTNFGRLRQSWKSRRQKSDISS